VIIVSSTAVAVVQEALTPTVVRPTGVTVVLTGADGSSWDLTHGPVRLQPGVLGFRPSDVEHLWSASPALAGALHRGYRVPPQPFRLPVFLQASGSLAMRDLDAALWRALSPDADCLLTVIAPDAVARSINLRFVGVGDAETSRDPMVMLHEGYPLTFIAGDPFWQGAPEAPVFRPAAATPVPFYSPPGSTHVLATNPSNTAADATVRNNGDVASWPVYAVTGPVSSFTLGVGDSTVAYGAAVASGKTVWIDTHPARQTVGFAEGENSETAWLGLTSRQFAPIPPGQEVPITASLIGSGTGTEALVRLTPRYRRPW
jgi:hypothetical protein